MVHGVQDADELSDKLKHAEAQLQTKDELLQAAEDTAKALSAKCVVSKWVLFSICAPMGRGQGSGALPQAHDSQHPTAQRCLTPTPAVPRCAFRTPFSHPNTGSGSQARQGPKRSNIDHDYDFFDSEFQGVGVCNSERKYKAKRVLGLSLTHGPQTPLQKCLTISLSCISPSFYAPPLSHAVVPLL